jgi:hypothetical protein
METFHHELNIRVKSPINKKAEHKDGRVSKNELLSWIVSEFRKAHFKKSLAKIRDDHFDEVLHLEAKIEELKAAKKSGLVIAPDRKADTKRKRDTDDKMSKSAEE